MQKDSAHKLEAAIKKAAADFSRSDRALNPGETFEWKKTHVANDDCALVLFQKKPSTKWALTYFYWVNTMGGQWRYFFPSYGHVSGMEEFAALLKKVEAKNYPKNFIDTAA